MKQRYYVSKISPNMGKFTYSKRQTMEGKSSSCMMSIQDFTKDVEY